MKKLFSSALLLLLLSGSLVAASLLSAASPGSAQDPLITESYLTQQLAIEREARQALEERLSVLEAGLAQVGGQAGTQSGAADSDEVAAIMERLQVAERQLRDLGALFLESTPGATDEVSLPVEELQVVSLGAGEAVYAAAGSQLVLRFGEVSVLAPPTGGIADLTAAEDLQHGETVKLNHLLLVPRDDERGLVAHSDAIFLLRGTIRYR